MWEGATRVNAGRGLTAKRTPGPPSVTGPRAVVRKAGWGCIGTGVDSSEPVPLPGPPDHLPEEALLSPSLRSLAGLTLLALVAAAPVTHASQAKSAKAPATPAKATPAATPAPAPGASQRNAVIIEGDDHLFMVASPKGWVLDDTSGMGSKIRCVLYPRGETWASAATVMYVNPYHGMGLKERTLSAMIAENEKAFRKSAPKGRISDAGTLSTAGGKTAQVHYFAPDGRTPVEAVTYVPEQDLVMLIVLSSRTAAGFQEALPAYRELVSTYAWVGSHREFGR